MEDGFIDLLQVSLPEAYDQVNDAMFVLNGEGRIIYCNRAATILFGYANQEMLNNPVEMLVPDDVKTKHVEFRKGFVDNPMPRQMGERQEINGRHKNGTTFRVRVALSHVNTARGLLPVAQVRRAEA